MDFCLHGWVVAGRCMGCAFARKGIAFEFEGPGSEAHLLLSPVAQRLLSLPSHIPLPSAPNQLFPPTPRRKQHDFEVELL